MKLYTRTGDDGTTGLVGGKRVSKDDLRLETYGTVDELNAALGLADAACSTQEEDVSLRLRVVMNDLFSIGASLAAPEGGTRQVPLPALPGTDRLEAEIDAAEAELPPLANFILPGGSELAARLHLARCVCRRAERLAVHLSREADVATEVIVYLNRLSDWLFAQARLANLAAGVRDVPWNKPNHPTG